VIVNGWRIYFLKRLFGKQRRDLQNRVRELKKILAPEEYKINATVKLYTAIMVAIKEIIPIDPRASHFALTGNLQGYGRVKKMGIPDRYRLFFRAIESGEQKTIFILWLGYPRKEGDKNDCYRAFTRMVVRGDFPDSLEDLILESQED
jgi:toxin YhaV